VPTKAITMGIGTIFKAREIILMAWNGKKASIIKKAIEGVYVARCTGNLSANIR
jgi:glucosamine-6-phosphate deaminase